MIGKAGHEGPGGGLVIPGPAGRLEAVLDRPRSGTPAGAAVVCHPHPQHGGTLDNKVAYSLARAFVQCEYVALRFNFRGTGRSDGTYDEGRGELDDARAALAWLRKKESGRPLWLAGFSFGAAIAIRAALEEPVAGLVTVAPAVRRFANGLANQPACPWLIVQGDADELVDIDDTIEWFNGLEPGPELLVLEGAEHFFHGRLVELRSAVADFIVRASDRDPRGAPPAG